LQTQPLWVTPSALGLKYYCGTESEDISFDR
jgi:hypothetical protein